jgi:hypothetical protein
MEQKKVFSYDGKTGLYVGESVADESPLEPGVFLIPRHATEQEPPAEVAAGFAAFWRGNKWEVEAVPEQDDNLDGVQDAPQGFEPEPEKPGFFRRMVKAVFG